MQHKKPANGKRSARSAGHASASLRRSRRRNRVSWKNVLLILCCVVLPPLGFVLVWRSSWRVTYKYIAFGAMAALMVGALVLSPWPTQNEEGSVTMVQREPEMEIYGPELPDDLVEGYEPRAGESALSEDQSTPTPSEYVYAMIGSQFYHTYTCRYAYDSAQKITAYEAYYLGYKPCSACSPPVYRPGTIPD